MTMAINSKMLPRYVVGVFIINLMLVYSHLTWAQGSNDDHRESNRNRAVDLTILGDEYPAGDDDIAPVTNPASTDDITQAVTDIAPDDDEGADSSRIPPAVTLTRQDPEAVRLTTLGVVLPQLESLDRIMWRNSDVDTALILMERLPENRLYSATIDRLLRHVMINSALPPQGATEKAGAFAEARLNWLAAQGLSNTLAEMTRQLPDDVLRQNRQRFLADHDLITRNDAEACAIADAMADASEDFYWFQIQSFCALINQDTTRASFQLDILEARGVQDDAFFTLMRQRIEAAAEGAPELNNPVPTALNLALMDSGNIDITLEMIAAMPTVLSQSLANLHYQLPEARYYHLGRVFYLRHKPLTEQIEDWRALPEDAISSTAALTDFTAGQPGQNIDAARVRAWHAMASVLPLREKIQLATTALKHDFFLLGGEAAAIWSSHVIDAMAQGETAPEDVVVMAAAAGMVLPDTIDLPTAARAWIALPDAIAGGAVSLETLRASENYDAIPVLNAAGITVPPLIGDDRFAAVSPAIEAKQISFPQKRAIEALRYQSKPAEVTLAIAVVLDDMPLYRLTRDDAAMMVGVLYDAGLVDASRDFALEIIRGWGLARLTHDDG